MLILFTLILISAIALGARSFRQTPGTVIDRLLASLLPISGGLLLIVLLTRVTQGPSQDWNEAKLAPVVGMTRGYALYQNPDHGAMTGWLYGPVGAIILLPTALAGDPTTAVFIGILIAAACYLAPIAWAMARASRGRVPTLALLAFIAAAWESFDTDALSRCLVIAAPDAPALGLACCACVAIYLRRSRGNMLISALAAILCIWTKQNYLPLLPALVLWIWLVNRPIDAGIFSLMLLVIGTLLSALFLLIFGAANMLFHMFTLPQSHPWRDTAHSTPVVELIGLHDLLATCAVPLGLLALVFILDNIRALPSAGLRDWLRARPWMLYLLVAIFLIPSSLAGYLKLGGYVNSLACTDYFLLIAALAGFVEISATFEPIIPLRRALAGALLVYGLVLAIKANFAGTNGLVPSWPSIVHPYQNPQQEAFAYARVHPGEIYCPWNPLTTLLADGKLYHFEWGIVDRAVAQRPPSDAQYIAFLPPNLNRIVYFHPPQSTKAMEVLIDFRRKVQQPEMPNCIVYTR